MNGEIIDMVDQADGGVIISKGRVVNQEKINEMAAKERDRQSAQQALTAQVVNPQAPIAERNAAPGKLEALEKRIDSQDAKLDAILAALKK
jgi:hypothetical protein